MSEYRTEAKSDAASTAENFLDEIVNALMEDGEASDDLLNDYPSGDSYHHENHPDKDYDLQESAAILDELHRYEETDSGLWEGLEPRRAIEAQAAYTYGNAVYGEFQDLVKEINGDSDIESLLEIKDDIEASEDAEQPPNSPLEHDGTTYTTTDQVRAAVELLVKAIIDSYTV